MNAALGFAAAGPAAGAFVVNVGDRARARPAADALISAVEQLVVRYRFIDDVIPNPLARPVGERVHLDVRPSIFVVEAFEDVGLGARRGLMAARAPRPGRAAPARR